MFSRITLVINDGKRLYITKITTNRVPKNTPFIIRIGTVVLESSQIIASHIQQKVQMFLKNTKGCKTICAYKGHRNYLKGIVIRLNLMDTPVKDMAGQIRFF